MMWLLTSRRWTGPRPINAYVIEHRDGLVLFDTGQDRASSPILAGLIRHCFAEIAGAGMSHG